MDARVRNPQPFVRILLILMMFLLVYLVVGFVRQVGVSRQRQDELRHLDHEIAVAVEERTELERGWEYAQSNAAAEEWARQRGWSRDDEVLVVVVDPGATMSLDRDPALGGAIEAVPPQEAWWDLFFGER